MKTPHLGPALAAVLLLIAGLIGGSLLTQSVIRQHIHALAPSRLSEILKAAWFSKSRRSNPICCSSTAVLK